MSAPLLEVRGLSKHFSVRRRAGWTRKVHPLRAVDDVSFTLDAGETLGLVGESGCGKSTLGRTVLGLLAPTAGEVLFEGEHLTEGDPRLRRTAQIVFQDPYTSLPPKMRVGRIIAEPLLIHDLVPRADVTERVASLLRDVGLKREHASALPHQLSGGQRQRVGIARALAVEPKLIVADEAVSALDVSVQAQILNLLKDLQEQRGIALLFISHDLGVVRYMSHRIAVMYLGRIVELGPAVDLVEQPLHPYTRGLLAAVPRIDARRSAVRIESEPPNPVDPPEGCRFHPRCPIAQSRCSHDPPQLLDWLPGREAACHFALDGPDAPAPVAGDRLHPPGAAS
ncbi:MAG: ABC transporter ATP-binding protein [Actinobacteria bacterium]|jgi:oligopeptide transport system ATP-binding protein|nr:ABC transporter ATP-binding protein [Actinomycetota bacterium]